MAIKKFETITVNEPDDICILIHMPGQKPIEIVCGKDWKILCISANKYTQAKNILSVVLEDLIALGGGK